MSHTPASTHSQAEHGAAEAPGAWGHFVCGVSAERVRDTARTLSRRGKLPGFEGGGPGGELFSFAAFGAPIDYRVAAVASADVTGTRVAFHAKARMKVPLIFLLVAAASVWPGGPITDSLVRSYFPSYGYPQWVTWAWYLPITVLPLPFMFWRMWKNSKAAAHEHGVESIEVIRAALEG